MSQASPANLKARGPTVVITGASGGTGRSIVQNFAQAGYEVVAVDLKPLESIHDDPVPNVRFVGLDLRDAAGVGDVLAGAHAVVHFGSPPTSAGMTDVEAFGMIATAGFNIFSAAATAGVRRIAWASGIEVYGDLRRHTVLPITEHASLAPPGIYGSCKVLLEQLAHDFARWHPGLAIAGLRLSRIIYDSPDGRAKLRRLSSNPEAGADCLWSYVDSRDVATACRAWIESPHASGAEVFNLAAEDVHLPQADDLRAMLNAHGYPDAALTEPAPAGRTPFSTAKIRRMLGWRAEHGWQQILSESIAGGSPRIRPNDSALPLTIASGGVT